MPTSIFMPRSVRNRNLKVEELAARDSVISVVVMSDTAMQGTLASSFRDSASISRMLSLPEEAEEQSNTRCRPSSCKYNVDVLGVSGCSCGRWSYRKSTDVRLADGPTENDGAKGTLPSAFTFEETKEMGRVDGQRTCELRRCRRYDGVRVVRERETGSALETEGYEQGSGPSRSPCQCVHLNDHVLKDTSEVPEPSGLSPTARREWPIVYRAVGGRRKCDTSRPSESMSRIGSRPTYCSPWREVASPADSVRSGL